MIDYKLERLEEAARLEKSGNLKEWLAYCQEWAILEPNNFLAWVGIGDAFKSLEKDAEAIAAYIKGLEVAPEQPRDFFGINLSAAILWYRLGNSYETVGDYTNAIAALEKAAQIDPNSVEIWNNLGIAYVNANLPVKAFQAYKAGISANPGNVNILNNMGILYAQGQMRDGVLVIHRMLLEIDPVFASEFMQRAEQILTKK